MGRSNLYAVERLREVLDELAVLSYLDKEERLEAVAEVLPLLSVSILGRRSRRFLRRARACLSAFIATGERGQIDCAAFYVSCVLSV